jgi:hypothetical protein
MQGNTDSRHWHTHFEVLAPAGVEKLGFKQIGVNDDGTPIWSLNGRPIGPSNPITHDMWVELTRPRGVHNRDVLLPPETVFPDWPVDATPQHRRPNYEGWPAQTWNAIWGHQFARGTNPNLPQLKLPFGLSPYAPADIGSLGIRLEMIGPYGYGTGQSGMGPNGDYTSGPAFSSPLPGSGGAPISRGLPDWLGPNLGTISSHSFPNSLQSGAAAASGVYSGNGFLPLPHSRDLPMFNVGGYASPDPWNASTYVSPRASLPDQRLITSNPASNAPPYPWSRGPPRNGEPPSRSILGGGLDRAPYDQAPPAPRTPDSGPGTGGGNFDRGPSSPSPQRMNGLPDRGSSAFSDLLGRIPLNPHGPLASGSSEAPTTLASLLMSQPSAP